MAKAPAGIKIEKNVPLPGAEGPDLPFDKMEPGDSFFIDGLERTALNSKTGSYARKVGCKFSIRKEGEGFRVWMVEGPLK